VTIYAIQRRVGCYVTRSCDGIRELLVLDHVNDDPSQPSGVQVPAGGMVSFESLEAAALREIEEECGLTGLTFSGQLGTVELGLHDPGGPALTTYVHLEAPASTGRAWRHEVSGDGSDSGKTCCCRWEPLPLTFSLAAGHGAFLDRLTQ
jgi:8-oxo-dGTP pyrophosphatase MutT (NUDIX family)